MEEGGIPTATMDEHSEQNTIKGIRQLLSAVHTLHHSSSSDSSVKDIMEHLESVDVNFHRYSDLGIIHLMLRFLLYWGRKKKSLPQFTGSTSLNALQRVSVTSIHMYLVSGQVDPYVSSLICHH